MAVLNRKYKPVTIIQISEFPELQKRFLTVLLAELIWKEMIRNKENKRFDVLVFDEFQFMTVKPGSALSQLLREGRKYELSVILSSQFVSNYETEELNTLFQVGNIIIFKLTENDMIFSARIIDPENVQEWRRILMGLHIGEAILKGNYTINSGNVLLNRPIICKI